MFDICRLFSKLCNAEAPNMWKSQKKKCQVVEIYYILVMSYIPSKKCLSAQQISVRVNYLKFGQ